MVSAFMTVTNFLHGQVQPVARMDVDASGAKVELTINEEPKGGKAFHPPWLGKDKAFVISSTGPAATEKWQDYILSFTPSMDGKIGFVVRSIDYRKDGKPVPLWIAWDNFSFDGAKAINSDLQQVVNNRLVGWSMRKGARLVNENGNYYVELCHDTPIIQTIEVRKGQKVTIKGKYKRADGVKSSPQGNTPAPQNKPELKSAARWIWYPERVDEAKDQHRYFRKKVVIDSDVAVAKLFITADDSYQVYINGTLSQPDSKSAGDWKAVKVHNLETLLKKGNNVFAVDVANGSDAAGLILKGEVITDTGKKINFYSDDSWRCSKQFSPQWEKNDFQEGNWSTAKVLGDVLTLPWINHNFQFSNLLADNEKFLWRNHQEESDRLIRIDIAGLNKERAPHATVTYDQGRAFIDVNGKKIAPFAYISHRLIFQEFWKRQVENFGKAGTPILIINLPPFTKLSKAGNNDLNEKLDREMRRHLVLNPNSYIIPSFTLNPPAWWLKENQDEWIGYAAGPVDPNNTNVNRGRGCTASMASQKWREFTKSHITEMIRYIQKQPWSKRVIGYRFMYGINGEFHYFGMRREMPDTGVAMTGRFREWLRKKYMTIEALRQAWNDGQVNFDSATVPDAKERKASAHLLLRSPATEGKVLDFHECFQDNLSETIIDFAQHIKKETDHKLLVGAYYGYLLGMPYPAEGFHLQMQKLLSSPYLDFLAAPYSYDRCARDMGGNGLSRTLPALFRIYNKLHLLEDDTFTHLAEYNRDHSWLKTEAESVAVIKRQLCGAICNGYGIQYIEFPEKSSYGWFESPAIMNTIKKGIELYKDAPASSVRSGSQVCVVVSPKNVMYLSHTEQPATLGYNLISGVIYELSRTGAPFDIITPDEIKNKALPNYRLYLFVNCFYLDARERKDITDTIRSSGKTAIWLYASGAITENGISDKAISELTGISVKRDDQETQQVVEITPNVNPLTQGLNVSELVFPVKTREIKIEKNGPIFNIADDTAVILGVHQESRKPALAVKKFENWTSIYCAVPFISQAVLNNCLKQAGVHRYLTTGETVYVHPPFLMVHTKSGGQRTIFLPETAKQVKTMFSNEIIGNNLNQFNYNFTPDSTVLFYIE